MPNNTYGSNARRSDFSRKTHTSVGAGVIYMNYTGVAKFLIFNHNTENLEIIQGQNIGRRIIEKIIYPIVVRDYEGRDASNSQGKQGTCK